MNWKINVGDVPEQARPGDCFVQPPGTRHRVRNASATEDLVFYVIANEADGVETTKHLP